MASAEEFLTGNPQSTSAEDFLQGEDQPEFIATDEPPAQKRTAESFLSESTGDAPKASAEGFLDEGVHWWNPFSWQFDRAQFAEDFSPEKLRETRAAIGSLTEPLVSIPRVTASDLSVNPGTGAKVAAGVNRGAANLAEFFLSPLGIASLGTGYLPAAGQRAVAGAFALDMARRQPAAARAFGQAVGEGDTEKAVETGIGLAANTVLPGMAAGHAAFGKAKGMTNDKVANDQGIPNTPETETVSPDLAQALDAAEQPEAEAFLEESPTEVPTSGEIPAAIEVPPADPNIERLRAELSALEDQAGPAQVRGAAGSFERPPDLADELEGGGHGKIRKLGRAETADNEEAWRQAQRDFPKLFSEDGLGPDEVAASVSRETGAEIDPADLIEQLAGLKAQRQADLNAFKQGYGQQSQDADFQAQAVEGARAGKSQVESVGAEELAPGDKFRIGGEPVMVEAVKARPDDETMVQSVTVKDGPKFGTQVLRGDLTLKINAGSLERGVGAPAGLEAWADRVIEAARGRVSSGLDPELLAAYAVKGAAVLVRGVRGASEWAAEMVRSYGDAIRKHLPEIRRRAEELVARGWTGPDIPAELMPGVGERQFAKQVDVSSDISGDVKLQQGPRLYEEQTFDKWAGEAKRVIDEQGEEGAMRIYLADRSALAEPVRNAVGFALLKRLAAKEQLAAMTKDAAAERAAIDAQLQLMDAANRRGTDAGQALASYRMFAQMTEAGKLAEARRVIERAADEQLGAARPALENVKGTLQEANRETAGEVVNDPKVAPAMETAVEESLPNRANAKLLLTRTIMGLWDSLWRDSKVWQEIVSEQGSEVERIAREHYAGMDPGKTLATKLHDQLRIGVDAAFKLAKRLDAEFARQLAAEAKAAAKRAKEAARREEMKRRKIATNGSVWEREKAAAVKQLADAAERRLSYGGGKTTALSEFAGRLAAQLRAELARRLPQRLKAVSKLSEEQLLREAVTNADKYREVWRAAQEELRQQFADMPAQLHALDAMLGDFAPDLFSDRTIDVALRREMETRKMEMDRIVREHYTAADRAGKELSQAIAQRLGIEEGQAKAVADAIETRFKELATARKRAALRQLSLPARVSPRVARGLHERLIELSNLGALDDATFDQAVGEKMGVPTWTRELASEMKQRAEAVQKAPEGFPKVRKTIEMMNALARAKGNRWHDLPMSFWFANILSGLTTHGMNIASTAANTALEIGLEVARNPLATPGILEAAGRGLMKGGREAAEVLKTGMVTGTRLQKVEAMRPLEQVKFRGVASFLNAWKYNFRAMAAEDLVFFKSAEEAHSYAAAREIARTEKLSGADLERRTREILGWTEERKAAAAAVAEREGWAGNDRWRRINELLERARPAELIENAKEFALRSTFNEKPWGLLGAMAQGVNMVAAKYPAVRMIVPFTNIVANVTNEALNYFPPVGVARAVWGHWRGELEGRPITDKTALADQWAKALFGTAALTGLGVLAAKEIKSANPSFMVNGAGPRTPDQKKMLQETGWIPYSIKMGDRYYSYAWTPAAIGLAALGNFFDAIRYKHLDKTDLLNRLAYAVTTSGHVIIQQSFLSGIADFIETLNRDATKRGGETAIRTAARSAGSFLIPNALKQVDRIFDPTVYDAHTVEANLVASVPFARRLNQPALNALGEPVKNYVSSRFVSEASGDIVWNTLAQKQAWVSMPDRDSLLRGRPMSDDQYYRFVQRSGTAIRRRLVGELGLIRSSPQDKARAIVERIVTEERENTKRQM